MAYAKINARVKAPKKAVQPKKTAKKPSPNKGKRRVKTPAMINNPGGRPSEFDEASPKLIAFIRMGNTYECSAGCSRISYHTFNNWMRQGKDDEEKCLTNSKFFKFLADVRQAEMEAEEETVRSWRSLIPENWQAARDFLARRNPEKWGSKDRVDLTSNGETVGKPVFLPLKRNEDTNQ